MISDISIRGEGIEQGLHLATPMEKEKKTNFLIDANSFNATFHE